jgi:hypothetical protein
VAIRSAYRASAVNALGNVHGLSCASNEHNYARHIWDRRDARACMGALATVVVPWFVDRYAEGADWRAMTWWIHDHPPIASYNFSRNLPRSISGGMNAQGGGSGALSLHGVPHATRDGEPRWRLLVGLYVLPCP